MNPSLDLQRHIPILHSKRTYLLIRRTIGVLTRTSPTAKVRLNNYKVLINLSRSSVNNIGRLI